MSEVESKRAATEEVLGEILKLMGIRARLEVKELPAKEAEGRSSAVALDRTATSGSAPPVRRARSS